MKLNENTPTPLYEQLKAEIKVAIEMGAYPPGSCIPSEPDLSRLYEISRITVRRAIEELCDEGYLTRRQGKGTYVNTPKLQRKLMQEGDVQSFSAMCRANGMEPGAQVLDTHVTTARTDEQKFFQLEAKAPLLFLRRLRTADDEPIMQENLFFPYDRFKFLLEEKLDGVSLFDLLRDKYGIDPAGTRRTTLEIVRATTGRAEMLRVPVGEPLFHMNAYFINKYQRPLFIGRQYIVGSRYTLSF